jgi:DEAD/DEAH box helicase domain-containing protein
MPRIAFFDLETRRHAIDLRPDDEQAGWDALRAGEGGASAICIHDTKTKWMHIYDDNRSSLLTAAKHLEAVDVVVGYCSARFDVPVIEGLLGRNLSLRCHIDLYAEISRTCAERGIKTSVGDLKLDTLCRKNIGRGKIEHGSHAKALAAEGRWGELFNYCCSDVQLTHDLFRYICEHGGVHLNGHGWVPITLPGWVKE